MLRVTCNFLDVVDVDVDEDLPGDRLLGERLLGERLPGERLLGERLLGDRLLGDRLLGDFGGDCLDGLFFGILLLVLVVDLLAL